MSELNLDYFGKLISDTDRLAKLYKHIESLEQRVKELDSVIDSNKRDWVIRSKSLHSKIKSLEQKLESSELKLKEAVLALEEISNMPTHGIMNDNSAVRADKEIRKNRTLAQKALAKCNKE